MEYRSQRLCAFKMLNMCGENNSFPPFLLWSPLKLMAHFQRSFSFWHTCNFREPLKTGVKSKNGQGVPDSRKADEVRLYALRGGLTTKMVRTAHFRSHEVFRGDLCLLINSTIYYQWIWGKIRRNDCTATIRQRKKRPPASLSEQGAGGRSEIPGLQKSDDYPNIMRRSSSGAVAARSLNSFWSTSSTAGETNAGIVGPRIIFFSPR